MSCSGDSASPSPAPSPRPASARSRPRSPFRWRRARPWPPAHWHRPALAFPLNICMSAFTSMSVRPPTAAVGLRALLLRVGCVRHRLPPLRHCSSASRGRRPHVAAIEGRFLRRYRLRASSCSRLLASFESNPEKPPHPSLVGSALSPGAPRPVGRRLSCRNRRLRYRACVHRLSAPLKISSTCATALRACASAWPAPSPAGLTAPGGSASGVSGMRRT